jgi:hypothetical protein
MKKKYTKIISLVLSTLMLITCLTACSSGMKTESIIGGMNNAPSYDMEFDGFTDDSFVNKGEAKPESGTGSEGGNVADNRKIIEEYEMTIETKEFDDLLPLIKEKAKEFGGYIESSSTDNNRYSRYAYFTIRIPQGSSEKFNGFISENSNVIYSETRTTDVTLTYVDIQSRIASYQAEKEKLEELMEQATNLSDVLQIQNRLTDVIYQIESYESRLRTYDNLIDFTTIDLTIREVEKETVIEEMTIWEEIKHNLANGFEDVGEFLKNAFIWVISSIPYFLLIGGFAVIMSGIVVVLTKLTKKSKEKKKAKLTQESAPTTEKDKK